MFTIKRASSLAALAAVAGLMTAAGPAAAELRPQPAAHSAGPVAGYLTEEGIDIYCATGSAPGTPRGGFVASAVSASALP